MRRSLSFLVATKDNVDLLLKRAAERKLDIDKSPALGRFGSTAVVRVHGDSTKFWGDAEPGSREALDREAALVADLTAGIQAEQDHTRTVTEEV